MSVGSDENRGYCQAPHHSTKQPKSAPCFTVLVHQREKQGGGLDLGLLLVEGYQIHRIDSSRSLGRRVGDGNTRHSNLTLRDGNGRIPIRPFSYAGIHAVRSR